MRRIKPEMPATFLHSSVRVCACVVVVGVVRSGRPKVHHGVIVWRKSLQTRIAGADLFRASIGGERGYLYTTTRARGSRKRGQRGSNTEIGDARTHFQIETSSFRK